MVTALIPARGGSERIIGKNTKFLGNLPLIQWTIRAAIKSELFDDIIVSSDSEAIGEMAIGAGIKWIKRPKKYAKATSPDIEWIKHALSLLPDADDFIILRPTNPFRRASTINEAWMIWMENQPADSLRSIRLIKETPYKMWVLSDNHSRIWPLINCREKYYDLPTNRIPWAYMQSGCIQVFTRELIESQNDQTGTDIIPFFTSDDDAFDINTEEDWQIAEQMAKRIKPE
jgi:CMP-N,N'-diacetyllegionaminic acid synthase